MAALLAGGAQGGAQGGMQGAHLSLLQGRAARGRRGRPARGRRAGRRAGRPSVTAVEEDEDEEGEPPADEGGWDFEGEHVNEEDMAWHVGSSKSAC